MIAIIPAAGLGTRFLPFTKSVPKELVPIMGTPAIHCILEEAIHNGITSFCIVSSNEKAALKDYFTENKALNSYLEQKNKLYLLNSINTIIQNCTITFAPQNVPLGLGHAVLCAQNSILKDQKYVAIMLPDELLYTNSVTPASLLKKMYALSQEHTASVIAVKRVKPEEASSYGIISGLPLKNAPGCFLVDGMIEKPKAAEAPSNLAIIGRYVLNKAIFEMLSQIKPGSGSEIQLTDGIALLIQKGHKVLAYEYTEHRFDIGNPEGLLQANVFKNN